MEPIIAGSDRPKGSASTEQNELDGIVGQGPSFRPSQSLMVLPGQIVTPKEDFMRGHGTFVSDGYLVSSLCGVVTRVNKLISVDGFKSRYNGSVGDVVVGRITSVENKRWKVDVNSVQDAVLQLSSIILPGGAQRRNTLEDELQIRSFFEENDLISSEVQSIHEDGLISLHTRTIKYGKLENGQFLSVPSVLIRRQAQHFQSLPCNIDIILGNNGYIWVSQPIDYGYDKDDRELQKPLITVLEQKKRQHAEVDVSRENREKICRVANSIRILSELFVTITVDRIMKIYDDSLKQEISSFSMFSPELLPYYKSIVLSEESSS